MTYKPAGGLVTTGVRWGAGAEARMYTRREGGGDGREGEDSGRTAVPRSRWMLEGLFAVRGRQEGGREKEGCGLGRYDAGNEGGCNTCTWHGQCIRYPTNARNSLPLPPSLPRRISNAPNFPIATPASDPLSLSLLAPSPFGRPRDVPFTTPAYPSAGRCVQFARC